MHAITAGKLDEAMEYIDDGHALLTRRFFAVILSPMRPGSSTRYQLQARGGLDPGQPDQCPRL